MWADSEVGDSPWWWGVVVLGMIDEDSLRKLEKRNAAILPQLIRGSLRDRPAIGALPPYPTTALIQNCLRREEHNPSRAVVHAGGLRDRLVVVSQTLRPFDDQVAESAACPLGPAIAVKPRPPKPSLIAQPVRSEQEPPKLANRLPAACVFTGRRQTLCAEGLATTILEGRSDR
jgi:hypothetical protein